MESIIAAVYSVQSGNVYKSSTITIENLNVQRVVGRYRRVSRQVKFQKNFYDGNMWLFVPDASLNWNDHAVGCKCHTCAPSQKRK